MTRHLDCNGDDVTTWAGYVSARRNRQTGTLIVVVDDRTGAWSSDSLADYGDGNAPWWTVCDDHGTMIQHMTRRVAEWHASDPAGWCDGCAVHVHLSTPNPFTVTEVHDEGA